MWNTYDTERDTLARSIFVFTVPSSLRSALRLERGMVIEGERASTARGVAEAKNGRAARTKAGEKYMTKWTLEACR